MTTEQKNYMLVARFYIEQKNDPEGLELWLKRRRQNPMKGFFAGQPNQFAFSSSFNFYESKEGYSFWDEIRNEYTAWYESLPERHTNQIREIIKEMLEQPVNARKPIPIFQKEPDNNGGIVSACVINASDIEKPLPAEFLEWLASVEAKNPEHARIFKNRFSWEDWANYTEVAHPGRRALSGMCNFLHVLNAQTLYDFWPKLERKYPYPIPPRKIPFLPEEATQGRFLVFNTGHKREILFTNGKIWVFEHPVTGASTNFTWEYIAKEFSAIAE